MKSNNELSNQDIKKYNKRLFISRLRVINNHPFYGMLLMGIPFELDCECETAYTDGMRICFSPYFMDDLSDSELDFIMVHEILHMALKHTMRGKNYDNELHNIACDIVVNSIILASNNNDLKSITLNKYGISMHIAPDGHEGAEYTSEEVYMMLLKHAVKKEELVDDHSKWGTLSSDEAKEANETINNRLMEIANTFSEDGPEAIKKILKELNNPTIDWRLLLEDFIQKEVYDYSFLNPDNRFCDSDFYMPSFSELIEKVEDILFFIDTSGSISEDDMTKAYSEVAGALSQFEHLSGKLGFFDHKVYDPIPFEDIVSLKEIKPKGGGGTNFINVFKYIDRDKPPAALIILTDGYAPFPDVNNIANVPVLWLINNERITPPFGVVARFK